MTRVDLNLAAIAGLGKVVEPDMLRVGEQVAERAQELAPKRTGAGAASIHAEVVDGEVRVSWDPEHFYMLFQEVGTSEMSPRPFLRPALDEQYDV